MRVSLMPPLVVFSSTRLSMASIVMPPFVVFSDSGVLVGAATR